MPQHPGFAESDKLNAKKIKQKVHKSFHFTNEDKQRFSYRIIVDIQHLDDNHQILFRSNESQLKCMILTEDGQ